MVSWTKILNRVLAKLTSVRSWVTIVGILTLCLAVMKCFDLLFACINILTVNKQPLAEFKIPADLKEIIMFLLGAFVSTIAHITNSYFNKSDKWVESVEAEDETLPANNENDSVKVEPKGGK